MPKPRPSCVPEFRRRMVELVRAGRDPTDPARAFEPSAQAAYRKVLAEHGLGGSTGRRRNPYDNAKAESLMKTLKVDAVVVTEHENLSDDAADLPRIVTRPATPLGCTPHSAT